jgi:GT2 family glycosyltransferase
MRLQALRGGAAASTSATAVTLAIGMEEHVMDRVADGPPTSVVICAYTLERWTDLGAAVESVREQLAPGDELILVIDHNDGLRERATQAWPAIRVIPSREQPGLSGARNTGVEAAAGEIVAFLDDDARAEPGWLRQLIAPYADARVVGTGGFGEAAWDGGRPAWFPREFDWIVGCSYFGLPTTPAPIRNPIGCTMSFRRTAILRAGGFRGDVGRVGALPIGGEETELSIRIRRADPEARIVFVPTARVRHRVPVGRGTWHYFRSRCYQEGRSKARISVLAGAQAGLASERAYARRALPRGIGRGLRDAAGGDAAGIARAAAIGAGLAITTSGYLAGRLGLDPLPAGSSADAAPADGGVTTAPGD